MAQRWIALGMAQVLLLGLGVLPLGAVPARAEWAGAALVVPDMWGLLEEGMQQLQQGQLEAARATFGRVLLLARQARDLGAETAVIYGLGRIQHFQRNLDQALKTYKQALAISRESKNRHVEAATLNNIGDVQRDLGQLKAALKSYEQALAISRELKNRRHGEGVALSNIGIVQRDLGQAKAALKSFEQSLAISRELKNHQTEGAALSNIGIVQRDLGQAQAALRSFEQALAISREMNNQHGEWVNLNHIGDLQRILGQLEAALKSHEQALAISRKLKNRHGEGVNHNNIGLVKRDLGQLEAALKSYEQAMAISRKLKNHHGEGVALSNIGIVLRDLGQAKAALKSFEQSLAISRELKNRQSEGAALSNIGDAQRDLGQLEAALKSFEQALAIRGEVKDRHGEGVTHSSIGIVQRALGNAKAALKSFEQALAISREVKARLGEGGTLNNIGLVQSDLGQLEAALKSYEQALVISRESKYILGEGVALSNIGIVQRDLGQGVLARKSLESHLEIQLSLRRGLLRSNRQGFLSQNQWAASSLLELLIFQQRPAEAFRWLNLFSSADLADYNRLIEAKVNDTDAQRALDDWRQRQVALASQRQRLVREPNERLLQQLVAQEAAQNLSAEALISRYPGIAELLETRPADIESLQAGIPTGTVVLQPALLTGVPNRSNTLAVFVLTRGSVHVVTGAMPPKFTELLDTYRKDLENGDPYLERSQQLYDLLIRPVEGKGLLPAGSRLALISTGALRAIPLETLYDKQNRKYLIEKYPIHYLTRLSRTGTATSAAPQASAGSTRRALVIANPKPSAQPLPGTEEEARYLLRTFPSSRELRGVQATLPQFQQQASRYPILHLGTHGCFVPAGCPDLGMKANTLLFANGVNYPIAEAAQLSLTNTELLVLAGCQTARLTTDNDLGLSSLAYIWERAGARAVVANLWSTPDQASSQLNQAFYANLQAGLDKAESMRQAKLTLIHSDKPIHPNSWAPLILIGDPAPLAK
jgi:CHAT domain-containing protein/Tfp pilus assembly protein PilF